jgi:nitrous oxidase accessory protein NosD
LTASQGASWRSDGGLEVLGVTLLGALDLEGDASLSQVEVLGPGSGLVLHDADTVVLEEVALDGGMGLALRGVGSAQVTGLSVDDSQGGVVCEQVEGLALSGARLRDIVGTGLALTECTATLRDVDVTGVAALEDGTGGDGVVVRMGSLDWEGGTASDLGDRGVALLQGSQGTLKGLTLSGARRPLVAVQDGSTGTLDGVNASGALSCLFATEGTLKVSASQVHDCGNTGVLIGAGGVLELRGSTVERCPGGLVSLTGEGTRGTIEDNTLRDASDETCVSMAGIAEPMVVRRNTVERCAGQGISTLGNTDVLIEENQISSIELDKLFMSVADGIGLVDSRATVRGNTVRDTLDKGVALLRSSGVIEGNTLEDLGGAGVSLVDPHPERARVRGNTISRTRLAGVVVFGAQADVEDNQISAVALSPEDGLGDGVVFALGAEVAVRGNTISGCGANGVLYATGASGVIEGNELRDNAQFGVYEFCDEPNEVTVGPNTYSNNRLGEVQACEP